MSGQGRIKDEDIALVRERTSIVDVVGEQVTLKSAGGGNLKGLCPFHDERTPSFTVAPARNVYYCHGCGAGGDAISFIMQLDHQTFTEAIERLAAKVGIALRYEQGGSAPVRPAGQKQRLVAANADAAAFYAEQLDSAGARLAREFLQQRGFDQAAAKRYGCGFAPESWDALAGHLHKKGYTSEELIAAGLAKQGRSGLIDRFRRRLVWPIRDLAGDVIGFGARKIFDNDDGPKYLNTPETVLYKKSHVLYGIDQAKRDIAKQRQVVIVEGYTDVMACHLAGVPVAVATCGTAFGSDHISVLRRFLVDDNTFTGEVIFTFDGDEAGQRAALRAFDDDQRFVAQTFIAVSPDSMDPCDLRLNKGDAAVRDLVASREPMIAFALRAELRKHDLNLAEGRVAALRAAAPLVSRIKDKALRPEYARKLAGDLGMEIEPVTRAVADAGRATQTGPVPAPRSAPGPKDDLQWVREREALQLALQNPVLAGPAFDAVGVEFYRDRDHAMIRTAIAEAGGVAVAVAGAPWVANVRDRLADLTVQALVGQLAVERLLYDGELEPRYVTNVLAQVQLPTVSARIGELKSRLQRLNPVESRDAYLSLAGELFSLEQHARGLREQAVQAL